MGNSLVFERDVEFVEEPSFPHNMLVELTNICNHRCVFCGYKKMRREKRQCDSAFTKKLISEAYELGTREIGFYMIGEPLCSPEIEDFVRHAHDTGFDYIYLTTNGALADIKRMASLIEAGLNSVKFSVNAASRGTYEVVHGKDDFDQVRNNMADLRKYVDENDVDLGIYLSFIKNNLNASEADKLDAVFGDLIDKIYVFDCANQGGEMLELVDKGIVDQAQFEKGAKIPCDMIFNRLHITCEGYLDACCVDINGTLAAVDLHKVSLADAWNSSVMRSLRRKHLDRKLKGTPCFTCATNVFSEEVCLNKELMQ